MQTLFSPLEFEDARSTLLKGQEQEGIDRIYAFLQQELRGDKQDAGLYPTPLSLARFVVKIARPKLGETIFDPACGLGSFFVEAHRYLKDHDGSNTGNIFLGCDINQQLLEVGKAWMEANDIDTSHIRERDMLATQPSDGDYEDSSLFRGKYLILTHPPYKQKGSQSRESGSSQFNRSTENYYREYMRYCLEMLRKYPHGRCGIIVPQHFFYNSSRHGIKQRFDLLNEFNLQLLVRLPQSMFSFPGNNINYYSYLLYFDKQGTTSQVLCCKISEDEAPVPSHSRQSFEGVSFKEAESIWKRWREQSSEKPFIMTDEEQKYVWIIDAGTVRKQDENYMVIDCIPPQPAEKPSSSLNELMGRLVEQTQALHELAQQLQKRIKEGV